MEFTISYLKPVNIRIARSYNDSRNLALQDEAPDPSDADKLRNLSVTHNFESKAIREDSEIGDPVCDRRHRRAGVWNQLQSWSSLTGFAVVFYLRFTDLGRCTELGMFWQGKIFANLWSTVDKEGMSEVMKIHSATDLTEI